MDVDVDFIRAVGGQEVEDVLDYRSVHDRGHRLGHLAGQWKEPGAFARRERHRFHCDATILYPG